MIPRRDNGTSRIMLVRRDGKILGPSEADEACMGIDAYGRVVPVPGRKRSVTGGPLRGFAAALIACGFAALAADLIHMLP